MQTPAKALAFGLGIAILFIAALHIIVFTIFHGGNMLAISLRAITTGL